MKKRQLIFTCIIVIVSMLMLTQASFAQKEKNFYKGNTLYEEGRYDLAIKEYSRLSEQGLESGNLYFNLGNSYFKKGDLGKAILYYERAKRLIPRDGDLNSNYKFAFSKIAFNVPVEPSWPVSVLDRFDMFTINELAIILSFIFTAAFIFLTAGLFMNKIKRYTYIVLPVLIIIFLTFSFSLYKRISALDREAVITTENSEAKYEPLDNATTHFSLYEGMKVYVLELKTEWSKIRRPDGKIGWIRNRDMEKI